jgi:hypothetical protein
MRTLWILLGVVALTGIAFAQNIMPGTFSTPVQSVPFAPVLTPPTATLGSSLTPTVVTNKPLVFMAAPQEGQTEPTGTVATQAPESAPSANPSASAPRARYFDFVVSDAGASEANPEQSQSLVDAARSTHKNTVPVAGHTFTNDDINQMNQKYGARPPVAEPPQSAPNSATPHQ